MVTASDEGPERNCIRWHFFSTLLTLYGLNNSRTGIINMSCDKHDKVKPVLIALRTSSVAEEEEEADKNLDVLARLRLENEIKINVISHFAPGMTSFIGSLHRMSFPMAQKRNCICKCSYAYIGYTVQYVNGLVVFLGPVYLAYY